MDRGVILLSEYYGESPEATLAHEWRHCWQLYNWGLEALDCPSWSYDEKISYKKQIIDFFLASYCEYDALLFERKHSKAIDYTEEWYEWIIKSSR